MSERLNGHEDHPCVGVGVAMVELHRERDL